MKKRIISMLLVMCLVILLLPQTNVFAATKTSAYLADMKARADEIVDYVWIPTSDINTWNGRTYNGKTYFAKGMTVKGVPYSLFTTEVVESGDYSLCSLARYRTVASKNETKSAYCVSSGANRSGPKYGSCCADLVCEVFGGDFMTSSGEPRYHSVGGIRNSSYADTLYDKKMVDIKAGDALSISGHIIWISEKTDSKIVIYEQTPPIAHRVEKNISDCTDSAGYFVYNGSRYSVITRINVLGNNTTFIDSSTLSISLDNIGTVAAGASHDITGTVSSNYRIVSVTGQFVPSYSLSDLVTIYPSTPGSIGLKDTNINNLLRFGKLAVGEYSLSVTATDASGRTSGKSQDFKVGTDSARANVNTIVNFLSNTMKLNTAAISGILGNIHVETGGTFSPTAYNPSDTGGTRSYGICQWNSGTSRYTQLQEWCNSNGKDYKTLDGQLNFMKHELETNSYFKLSALKGALKTDRGAYDAAQTWATYYEGCASSTYETRKQLAQHYFWLLDKSSGSPSEPDTPSTPSVPNEITFLSHNDGSVISPATSMVRWSAIDSASNYWVRVKMLNGEPDYGNDNEDGELLVDTVTTNIGVQLEQSKLKAGQWVKIWVRAQDASGKAICTKAIYLFVVLERPAITNYSDGDSLNWGDLGSELTFKWNAVNGADKYRYSIKLIDEPDYSDDASGESLAYNVDTTSTSASIPKSKLLAGKWVKIALAAVSPNGNLYWMGKAVNVYLDPNGISKPTITSIKDGDVIDWNNLTTSLSFVWDAVDGASGYVYSAKLLDNADYSDNAQGDVLSWGESTDSNSVSINKDMLEPNKWVKFAVASVTATGQKIWGQMVNVYLEQAANEETYSGTCGNNLTWTLTGGKLIISGTGTMASYSTSSNSRAPWYNYRDKITSVTIGNSVTSIGSYAFSNCTSLTSVTIPNSVISIGGYAFSNCTSLTSITIPNSVTSIGSYAFDGCASLTSVTIPNSVTSIGSYTFYGCTSLTSVTIPDSVTSIGNYAFYHCYALTSFTIPNSVTSIGGYAFDGCISLTSVTIPDSVTSIGTCAFNFCSSLTSVTIPNSVTSISSYAFSNCTSLTSVTIPDSVTSIGDHAFYGCTSLTSVTIPDSVTRIYSTAFSDTPWLNSLGGKIIINGKLLLWQGTASTVTIPDSVTSIGDYAFSGCTSATSITIPDSVTSIGSYAFENCKLRSMNIPNSVTSIGSYAFHNCDSLLTVTLPNGLTSIKSHMFDDCDNLVSIKIPNSVTSIDSYAFYYCTKLNSVTIPDSVTTIGTYAFARCSILTAIVIPDSVTTIAAHTFDNCTSLKSVTISNSVTFIENYAFNECTNLLSVTIPGSVTSVLSCAFYKCSNLKSVTIEEGVLGIGSSAFSNCGKLETVTIPKSLLSIDTYAFSSSSGASNNLKDVFYAGSKDDYQYIFIASNANFPGKATVHYNSTGANDPTPPATESTINVNGSTTSASSGGKTSMTISLADNPGISCMKLSVSYDTSVLTLTDVVNGSIISNFTSESNYVWVTNADTKANGTLLTLNFKVADNAAAGDYPVTITVKECYNENTDDVAAVVTNGKISVTQYLLGDATGDGVVNGKDLIRLCQYVANDGEGMTLAAGADMDGNGAINGKDLILLCQLVANLD